MSWPITLSSLQLGIDRLLRERRNHVRVDDDQRVERLLGEAAILGGHVRVDLGAPEQRGNILHPDARQLGIGVVAEREGDRYAFIATQLFAQLEN